MKKLKIMFAGSPAFVFPVLEFLAKESDLLAVMTNAPTKTGRGKKLLPSPLFACLEDFLQTDKSCKALSKAEIIEVEKIDDEVLQKVKKLNCDLLVCYAFGKFFPPEFLALFPYGGINIHPSILPRWRGASPVQSAILAGDKITGVSIQTLANKMDSGKILARAKYALDDTKTAGEVLDSLTEKAIPLLRSILADIEKAFAESQEQNEAEASYCTKIKREKINWSKSALEIAREILALNPSPKAFSEVAGERITLLEAKALNFSGLSDNTSPDNLTTESFAPLEKKQKIGKIVGKDKKNGILVQTGNGILAIQKLQRQGKKELFWKDFLNGYKNFLDLCFE